MKTLKEMITMSKTNPAIYSKVFPYLSGFSVIDYETLQNKVPLWYEILFKSDSDNYVETIAKRKYGSILVMDDGYLLREYPDEYKHFCTMISDTMTHYLALFTTEYNPYDNVFESRTETYENGERKETNDFGTATTTNTIASRTNTNTIGASNETTTNSIVPQNASDFRNKDKSVIANDEKIDTETLGGGTDTTTVNAKTDTKTNNAYTDKTTVERHGNIGTTMTQEMGEREISYASKLKLVDFFLHEWLNYFSIGVWADGGN